MIPALLLACAPEVAPATLEAVIQVESGGDPFAVNVNRFGGPQPHPTDLKDAARQAERFITRGYSVDIGLMQVNSRNLAALGYTVRQVLDPCTNIRGGATILAADYVRAVQTYGSGQRALQAALSAYNTGDFYRGFANGYVARYYGPRVPAVAAALRPALEAHPATARTASQPVRSILDPYTSDSSIYAREVLNVRVQ